MEHSLHPGISTPESLRGLVCRVLPSVLPATHLQEGREGFTDLSRLCEPDRSDSGQCDLPDKELRYLRTVIVTAAVYRGFGRQLPLRSSPSLTYRHRAGVRLYTSSCELAESCVFDKQSLEPILCGSPLRGSTPCTEGTGSFCRVPSRGFSRTPSDARLAHLCRIAVRAVASSAGGFSRPRGRETSGSDAVALAGRGRLSPRSEFSRRPHRVRPSHAGGGILTACPSATPLGLALGPD